MENSSTYWPAMSPSSRNSPLGSVKVPSRPRPRPHGHATEESVRFRVGQHTDNPRHQFAVPVADRLHGGLEAPGAHDREVADRRIVPGMGKLKAIRAHRDARNRELPLAVRFELEAGLDARAPGCDGHGHSGDRVAGDPIHDPARDRDHLLGRRFPSGGERQCQKRYRHGPDSSPAARHREPTAPPVRPLLNQRSPINHVSSLQPACNASVIPGIPGRPLHTSPTII